MANLKYIGKNILNHELEVKSGNIIGDHTEVIRVTVVSDGGNKFAFEGATAPDFTIDEGKLIGLTNQIAQMILIHLDLVLQKTELGVVAVLTQQELPHTEHLV